MPITIDFERDIQPLAPTADPVAAAIIIADAIAQASLIAECITIPGFKYADAAKAIIRQAIIRRLEAGSGAIVTQTAGPYSQTIDSSQQRKALFWPSEIGQLQKLCRDSKRRGFHSIDTTPTWPETDYVPGEIWLKG